MMTASNSNDLNVSDETTRLLSNRRKDDNFNSLQKSAWGTLSSPSAGRRGRDHDRLELEVSGDRAKISAMDTTKSAHVPVQHAIYCRRWYILVVFSLIAAWSAAAWNTWGPISDTSKVVFNWSDGNVALLTNWSFITFVTSGLYFSWLMDVKGLRVATLTSTALLFVGLGIRALPVGIGHAIWTMNVGQIFIGLSNPIFLAGPPLLSSVWFPPHQRTTATAIASQCSYLGIGLSYFVGPLVVPNIEIRNASIVEPSNLEFGAAGEVILPQQLRQQYYHSIMDLMYIELAIGAALLICVFLAFPAKPPSAPSNTAAIQRKNFREGAWTLAKKRQFWVLGFAYGLSMGIYGAWSTMLDPIFEETVGVEQLTTGWIGVTSNIAGTVGGLVFARCVDYLGGRMRLLLMFLCGGASLSCVWIICLTYKWINFNIESLFAACILYGFLVNATVPIFYEVAVEGMYPVAEGITTMVIVLLNQSSGLVFVSVDTIPGVGVYWMNWAAFASVAVCLPLLLVYREQHNRLNVDCKDDSSSSSSSSSSRKDPAAP